MIVHVQAQGHLRQFRPDGREAFAIDLPAGATVLDLIRASHLPWEEIGLVAVNGIKAEESATLAEGDQVLLLAPMEGG